MKMRLPKIVSVLSALAILVGSLSTGMFFAGSVSAEAANIWDGQAAAITQGSGTKEDPYRIQNGGQLYTMVTAGAEETAGKYYKLTKDIYLNDVSAPDWQNGTVNSWPNRQVFAGNLDGDGHVVYGLYSVNDERVGLIPQVKGTVSVTNLGLESSYLKITGWGYIGGLIGFVESNTSFTVNQCYVGAGVEIANPGSKMGQGGLVGYVDDGCVGIEMNNCYSLASLTGPTAVSDTRSTLIGRVGGAAAGRYPWEHFHVRYSYGVAPNAPELFPLASYTWQGARMDYWCIYAPTKGGAESGTNSDRIKVLTPEQMQGAEAKNNMGGLDFAVTWAVGEAGQYPTLRVFQHDDTPSGNDKIWDGQAAAITEGDGTAENPYLITNGGQLYTMVTAGQTATAGKYYKITQDIYLNDATFAGWETGTVNAWPNRRVFAGNLDGDGHVIYGLYAVGDERVGLLPEIAGTVSVTNLGLENSYLKITGWGYVGGLIGLVNENTSFTVNHCYAGAGVEIANPNGGLGQGGLVGFVGNNSAGIEMNYCYSLASLTGTANNTGTLIGRVGSAAAGKAPWNDFHLRYSYGVALNAPDSYALVHTTYEGTMMDYWCVYAPTKGGATAGTHADSRITVVTTEQMQGAAARENMGGLGFGNAWIAGGDGVYPTLKVFRRLDGDVWNGREAASFAGGTGTEADPYLIENGGQLYKMLVNGNATTAGKYYKITQNIYLNDISDPDWQKNSPNQWISFSWSGDGWFAGHLDGDGHKVFGLYYGHDSVRERAALIPTVNTDQEVEIKNLGIENAYLADRMYAAGLVAIVQGSGSVTISHCYVGSDVEVKSSNFQGGLICFLDIPKLTMENCYSLASLTGAVAADHSGALIGFSSDNAVGSTIRKCYGVVTNDTTLPVTSITWPGTRLNYNAVFGTSKGGVNHNNFPAVVEMEVEKLQGAAAESFLVGFDFENEWLVNRSTYPTLLIFGGAAGGEEDLADQMDGGTGTEADPYRIRTPEQLQAVRTAMSRQTRGKYFKLMNDIAVNDVSKSNWKASAVKWDTDPYALFCGYFNGDGHVVRGLYLDAGDGIGAALFSRLGKGAVVEKVGVESSYFKAQQAAAIAIGVSGEGVTVRQCYADETVEIEGSVYCAGLISDVRANRFTLNNCFFTGKLTGGTDEVPKSGFVATFTGISSKISITISGCYTATADDDWTVRPDGPVMGDMHIVNVYGTKEQSFRNDWAAATYTLLGDYYRVDKADMLGDKAKTTMKELDFTSAYITKPGKTPRLRVFTGDVEANTGTVGAIWSGAIAAAYAGGTGTEADPYLIETAEQLALLVNTMVEQPYLTTDKHYALLHDIRLNDTSAEEWYKKDGLNDWFDDFVYRGTGFQGHFDGRGHTVEGIWFTVVDGDRRLKNDWHSYALFPTLGSGAQIENVAVANFYSSPRCTHVGGIAGGMTLLKLEKPVSIQRCIAANTCLLNGSNSGGMIAHVPQGISIIDCLTQSQGEGIHSRGTLVGMMDSTVPVVVTNCLSVHDGRQAMLWYSSDNGRPQPILTNVYSTYGSTGVKTVGLSELMGDKAKDTLKGFDFDHVWLAVEDGTPTLRVFGENAYSRPKRKVTISFYTFGGSSVPEVSGYPGEKIPWPDTSTVTRNGDSFVGWYMEDTCVRPYPGDTFLEYDMVLYAKWTVKSFTQNFETYPYGTAGLEGLGEDYERYRPGVLGYQMGRTHDGLASLHRLGRDADAGEQDFQLFEYGWGTLENGREYTMTFWIYPETVNDAKDFIKLVHTDYLDVSQPSYYVENICSLGGLKVGEWQQVKFTFKAYTDFLAIRTPALSSLYFDSFVIAPSGKIHTDLPVPSGGSKTTVTEEWRYETVYEDDVQPGGTQTDIQPGADDGDDNSQSTAKKYQKKYVKKKNSANGEATVMWIWILVAAGVVVVGGGVCIFLLLRRKKNKQKQPE